MRARVLALVVASACFDKPPRPNSSGGDGGGDAVVSPDADTAVNIAFVTSSASITLGSAGYTTLDDLDAVCRAHAGAAMLKGTFVAWASDPITDAYTRLGSAEGWMRTDMKPFAASKSELVAGHIWYPLHFDEHGNDVFAQSSAPVATDTLAGGNFAGVDCLKDVGTLTAGAADGGTGTWTDSGSTAPCYTPARIYCFQIDHHNSPPPPSLTSRHAFLTDLIVKGDAGSTFDNECVMEATAQSLGGSFKALVAYENQTGLDRFSPGADWVRLDGVRFMKGDKSGIDAPLDVTAKNAYVDERVWGGATSFFTAAAGDGSDNCTDWMSGAGNARTGRSSRSSPTEGFGGASSATNCGMLANSSHLYCLEL